MVMGVNHTDSGVLDNIGQHDILIAVVGNAGVGKSTFINEAVTESLLPIDQASKINNGVQYVVCPKPELYQDRKVVFLDIPAFDSESDEKAIQNKLKRRLRVVISKKLNISGILYLHRAMEVEFSSASLRHLTSLMTIFEESNQSPIGVLLVLTTQAHLRLLTRLQRKKEIQEKWNTLFPLGASQSTRFENSSYSAWEIVIDLTTYSNALAKQSNPLRSIVSTTRPTTSIHMKRVATGSGESLKRRLALLGLSDVESLPAPLLSTHTVDKLRSTFDPVKQKATPEKADGPEVNIENPR
ncbi:hypothetical protein P691DRAFT_774201 [Macrolepiota fuliginosa MF-IS2]|uniref:G domain-containing protein n=1 Tax=Macrolepiota fuliginosa MF-IS2 TaxID=1400762 RepID=A0A9P6C6A4_9AGAR|nr:hypothetical protein P691DRAFT_774201 [Macrolepiota fuliginosa MF-IS2]